MYNINNNNIGTSTLYDLFRKKKSRIKAVTLKHKSGQTELVNLKRKINTKVHMSQLFKVQVMISG